jgi:hypothetical protein
LLRLLPFFVAAGFAVYHNATKRYPAAGFFYTKSRFLSKIATVVSQIVL